ncbi:MAG: histidine phosphatase family protein [Deltaproteobacteria bacterium]|jgi:broad specificity phosphatase PhoE|nr:histidine phosphatase family protein [Deltaproteobacteria bacterium]
MSEIYFIRHGQASFGASDYDRLSPIGIQQARIMADHLLSLGIVFDAIYSGRMKRQRDTAGPLCEHYSEVLKDGDLPGILPAFDEYDARALLVARTRVSRDPDTVSAADLARLRQDKKAFQVYFSQTVDRWLDGHYDGQEGVEPWLSFCARVRGGVEFLKSRHGKGHRIAVFTSGGPISVIMQLALGLSHIKTLEISWQVMNASLTCVKYNPSGLSLSVFNDTTPLLLEKDPALLTYR